MHTFPSWVQIRAWLTRPTVIGFFGIALLFFLPRVANLGQVLTVDEPLWQARAHTFIEAVATGNLTKTSITGQPGVTTMWIASLATPWNALRASQIAIASAVTIAFLLSLALLRRIAGPIVALAAGVLLALDPFFIAHSRVVHTDALLASFMLLSLLCLLLAWETTHARYLAYAGIATALAALSKLFGLFLLFPAILTISLAPHTVAETAYGAIRPHQRFMKRLAYFGVPFIVSLLLLWPVLMISPRTPLAFVIQRSTAHSQDAAIGSGGGDTWYYPREFVRRLSPIVTVLLPIALLGIVIGNGKLLRKFPARHAVAALLCISLLFVAALSFAEQKSDRYILIMHLVADIVAGAALVWIADMLARYHPRRRTLFAMLFVAIAGALMARDVIRLHPYTMAHWNRLLPIPTDAKLGWGEGLDQAAAYLRELHLPNEELTTASLYPGVLAHFLPGVRVERFTQYQSPDFRFVVLYRSMYGRDPGSYETAALQQFLGADPKEGMIREVDGDSFRLEKIIVVDRLPFVWIFRRLSKPSQET